MDVSSSRTGVGTVAIGAGLGAVETTSLLALARHGRYTMDGFAWSKVFRGWPASAVIGAGLGAIAAAALVHDTRSDQTLHARARRALLTAGATAAGAALLGVVAWHAPGLYGGRPIDSALRTGLGYGMLLTPVAAYAGWQGFDASARAAR